MTDMITRQLRAAEAYITRGWKVFALNASKMPLRNCHACRPGLCPGKEDCRCPDVACHGFYAATDNIRHVTAMLWRVGEGGTLAVRTGPASGIVALDAEGDDKDEYGQNGVSVLDEFPTWTEGIELPATLKAHTSGGGVHLLYRLPAAAGTAVGSRNRALPNLDIKGEGGYIAVPPAAGRRWDDWQAILEEPGDELLAWMTDRTGGRTSSGAGGTGSGLLSSLRTADTIPSGTRYEFLRDLVYHLRRSGTGMDEATSVCRGYWERFAQPPAARYEFPWSQVVYELGRAWLRVEPEQPLSFAQQNWVDKARKATV